MKKFFEYKTLVLFVAFVLTAFIISVVGQATDSTETDSSVISSSAVISSSSASSSSSDLESSLNSELSSIEQSDESKESTISYEDVQDIFNDDVNSVMSTIADGFDALSETLNALEEFVNFGQDHAAISEENKVLVSIVLLSEAKDQDLFKDEDIEKVVELEKQLSLQLESFEKSKYSDSTYDALTDDSQEFQGIGKKTQLVVPREVVMCGKTTGLLKAPIKYDGHILISLDDVLQYVNADVQETESTGTVSLQSDKVLLEFSKGMNVAYKNDKSCDTIVPVLYFKGSVYICAEFFADVYQIPNKYVADTGLMILYGG